MKYGINSVWTTVQYILVWTDGNSESQTYIEKLFVNNNKMVSIIICHLGDVTKSVPAYLGVGVKLMTTLDVYLWS